MLSDAPLTLSAGHALPLLLDVAAKSLAVSAAALAAPVCLRRASAATRHLVLLAGLGVLLSLPALMALLPRQEFPRPVPAPRAVPAAAPVPALPMPMALPVGEAHAMPVDAAPIAAPPLLPAPPAVTSAPLSAPPDPPRLARPRLAGRRPALRGPDARRSGAGVAADAPLPALARVPAPLGGTRHSLLCRPPDRPDRDAADGLGLAARRPPPARRGRRLASRPATCRRAARGGPCPAL